jgi:hypothetical protein
MDGGKKERENAERVKKHREHLREKKRKKE